MKMKLLYIVLLIFSKLNKIFKKPLKYTDDFLILFICPKLGDFIVLGDMIRQFREKFPERKVSIICSNSAFPIIKESQLFDQVYLCKNRKAIISAILKIKAHDLVITPFDSMVGGKNIFSVSCIVADTKIAFSSYSYRHHYVLNKLYEKSIDKFLPQKGEEEGYSHYSIECAAFFSSITGEVFEPKVYDLQPRLKGDPDPYFVVNFGASAKEKCWQVEKYVKVIEYVTSQTKLIPVMIGGKFEAEKTDEFAKLYSGEFVNDCCKTSIRELIDLTGNAAFYLGNDTGTAHVAVSCGIPYFVILSQSFGNRFFPYVYNEKENTKAFVAVTAEEKKCNACLLKGEPCYSESCQKCIDEAGVYECLNEISADDVINAIKGSGVLEKYTK